MHEAALSHLSTIENTCAMEPARLKHLNDLPAREAVENIANKIVILIKECHEVAPGVHNQNQTCNLQTLQDQE
eukprot:1161444-Pelagomonas_calceolata.AAC.1